MINKLEQKRQELLIKYELDIHTDFSSTDMWLCPEFVHLCIDSSPEFAIRVLESLYGKNKLEILK